MGHLAFLGFDGAKFAKRRFTAETCSASWRPLLHSFSIGTMPQLINGLFEKQALRNGGGTSSDNVGLQISASECTANVFYQ